MDLRIDGVAQGITQLTGIDGCTTWLELAPSPVYEIEENLPEVCIAPTPSEISFSLFVSGGDYSHTSINWLNTFDYLAYHLLLMK